MKPLVSIWCMTYNQVEYIRDAIEGFLMQETDFPYEVVIHDDASTDGTTEILKEYEAKYPKLIKVIYQKENTFNNPNRKDMINAIKKENLHGKYVAYCEGDDYWTDIHKLQKQVQYMEEHEACTMITHNAILCDCEKQENRILNEKVPKGKVGMKELIYQRPVLLPTASVMIRTEYMYLQGFFKECSVGDYPLKLYVASKGYIYYMDEVMSVYRYMAKGSWTRNTYQDSKKSIIHYTNTIDFLKKYNEYTNREYENYIWVQMNHCSCQILKEIKDCKEEEVKELWKSISKETDGIYDSILEKVYACYRNISSEQQYIEQLEKSLAHVDHITLWGTGKFSKYYAECLERYGLQIEDYVVSKRTEAQQTFLGKKVWEIQELVKEKKNYKIVVAVGFYAWASVLDTILEYDVKNYYSPFFYEQD